MNKFWKKWSLTASLILFVFAVMLVVFAIAGAIVALRYHKGLFSFSNAGSTASFSFSIIALCIFLGITLTGFFSKKALNPIRKVIRAIHKVAGGDFDVHVDIKGVGELEELSQSFNKMTHELASIETLRSDFVNNFSHEFKTPIVSIRGFAKLLRDGNLNEEEKREYLNIIIAESERLAELSTNVLNISKYENIEIIADKAPFRLDEQIRKVVVLTEPKWSAKDIAINAELDKVILDGNEDLIQQIWLNLLDNAIKFSHQGGMININLKSTDDGTLFSIHDDGVGMDEQTRARIFDKFYQGDTSHAKAGNGLGLAIVQRIVDLCGGTVEVESEPEKGSIFIVLLP